MTKITQVSKLEIARKKDGTAIQGHNKAGGWSLWNLYDADNVKYGVFESVLGKEVKVGDSVLLNFVEEPWEAGGKKGVNRKITDVTRVDSGVMPTQAQKPQQTQAKPVSTPSTASKNEGLELLREINRKVEEILARIP